MPTEFADEGHTVRILGGERGGRHSFALKFDVAPVVSFSVGKPEELSSPGLYSEVRNFLAACAMLRMVPTGETIPRHVTGFSQSILSLGGPRQTLSSTRTRLLGAK